MQLYEDHRIYALRFQALVPRRLRGLGGFAGHDTAVELAKIHLQQHLRLACRSFWAWSRGAAVGLHGQLCHASAVPTPEQYSKSEFMRLMTCVHVLMRFYLVNDKCRTAERSKVQIYNYNSTVQHCNQFLKWFHLLIITPSLWWAWSPRQSLTPTAYEP